MKEEYRMIIDEINTKRKNYSISDILVIVNNILKRTGYYNYNCATQIVRITKEFGILVYRENLQEEVGYKILKGDKIKKVYKSNKVIIVNKKHKLDIQRFYVACGLVYLLFCEEESINKNKIEFIAREFLMPRKVFQEQFNFVTKNGRMFTIMYLSKFFKVNIENVEKKIKDLT